MATTTPNYGWSVPTSTDLVKDGATAIETLGDSVDATVKALNPETTLGDIAYRSATANTNTRLGIGTTGQVLVVSGGVPTWGSASATATSYTLLNTGGTTLSGNASVTISSLSGYNKLYVTVESASTGAQMYVNVRLNAATTNYRWRSANSYAYTTYSAGNYTAVSSTGEIELISGSDSAASTGQADLLIDGCNSTGVKTFEFWSGAFPSTGSTQGVITGGGVYNSTSVISSIVVRNAGTGNFDAGTVYVYGAN
jgi:hypothetical protein